MGSGFGLETATRCLAAGMKVAILDVSADELASADLEAVLYRIEGMPSMAW